MLSPLARHLFPSSDDPQLVSLFDDNQRIEPEWYCPIIPMVLVNGAEGIGTGYSTNVPNYNPREIVANLKRMIAGIEPEEMVKRDEKLFLLLILLETLVQEFSRDNSTCRTSKVHGVWTSWFVKSDQF